MEWIFNFDLSKLSTGGRIALAITGTLPLLGWLLLKFQPETLELGVDVLSLFNLKFKFRKKFREELAELAPNAEHQFKISPLKPEYQDRYFQTVQPREGALLAWEKLAKVLIKALDLYGHQSARSLELKDAMNLLCAANIISGNQASILLRFYQLGKDIQDNPNFSPNKKSSYEYQQVIEKLAEWLNNEINRNQPTPKKPPRKTMVESFIPPGAKEEHPHVVLTGIRGTSTGRHWLMDKATFTLGANQNNDVVILGDEYVSGNHASLHFESGILLLTDRGSKNGTYLNGKHFTNNSLPVNFGDEIQIGTSMFKISAA